MRKKGEEDRTPALRHEDIVEKFVRSAGKGGQNVNKTSTCVYLKHLPTGIEVKCQQERTQSRNRELALELLAEKVRASILREKQRKEQERERERRRRRPRPARLKERILESKKKTAEKKRQRTKRFED